MTVRDEGSVGRSLLSAFGATEGRVTQTKQMKIGLCEQVRVNWKTVVHIKKLRKINNP
jgi:hypothetical protein